jgi:hypothetical protein
MHQADTSTSVDITLHCDNMNAITLALKPSVLYARSKHIELHHHDVQEQVLARNISINHITTEKQPADILTKALPTITFEKHRSALGVKSLLDFTA